MIGQLYSKIELSFWNWAIPVLSRSQRLRRFLGELRPMANRTSLKKFGLQSLLVASAGFIFGIVISIVR
ncbi:MAG TPA: hypothetical protein VMS73_08685 [Anaerolineaceae bacterium]|nr:hypothetical protein [Anaerolineaceae bacterium]